MHATVRNRNDPSKASHLEQLAQSASGTLRLFDADLLSPAGFSEAFSGCKVVVHTASPFRIQGVKDPQRDLIDPALIGTRNVLAAVNECPTVERVVLTSSVVAIHADGAEHQPQVLNEALWNECASLSYQPYAYSKTLAEREAWRLAEAQTRWKLVTINPGFILGPSLSKRVESTSVDLMLQLVDGRGKSGLPELYFEIADVRDVAQAHLLAASLGDAQGRHIISNGVKSFPELASLLRDHFHDRYPIPTAAVPKALMYLVGPFMGFSWRFVRRNVGVRFEVDSSKSRTALGLEYRPIEQTLVDSIEQLEQLGLIRPTQR